MASPTALFGLIGYPISHSRSPKLFASSPLASKGAVYQLFPLEDITTLPSLCRAYRPCGLNVTSPHKTSVLSVFSEIRLSPEVQALFAANVLCLHYDKDSIQVCAYNTDVEGFIYGLRPHLCGTERTALILGTGGAARAADYALRSLGFCSFFASRSGGNEELNTYLGGDLSRVRCYEELADILPLADVVVNATPLGRLEPSPPNIDYSLLPQSVLGYDLNYADEFSPFMQEILAIGGRVCDGSAMLLGQAKASWELWSHS